MEDELTTAVEATEPPTEVVSEAASEDTAAADEN
jgi:hypothetical protein